MSGYVELLNAVMPSADLKPADVHKFNVLVEKALKPLIKGLPLEDARRLDSRNRAVLAGFIREGLTLAELKAVSKKWAPKRKWKKDNTASEVSVFLLELLHS